MLEQINKEDNVILRVISTSKIDPSDVNNSNQVQRNLSLSIIKNLMKKHEGQLQLDSFENSGAAFVLVFPLKRKMRK